MRAIEDMSILVTGGGSGIGEGIARHFAARGARVTISGRRADKVGAVAKSIGPSCLAVAGDIKSAKDRKRMLSAAIEHGGKLDVLVNNAANMYRQSVDAYTEDVLKDAFETNVISAMMLSSAAVPHLEETRGAILFMGSTHTRRAFPGASPYATTKAAVEGLTKVMAAELGPRNIRVTCILPGAVSTELNIRANVIQEDAAAEFYDGVAPMHVLGRIGTCEEIAESAAHLACAEWITGVALEVDGGIGLGVSKL
jgi:NAD(P)-dependent dehydrogenase (short-subunit alcohol dehydrogenase family)